MSTENHSDLQAVVDAGIAAAEPVALADGRTAFALPAAGKVTIVEPINEKHLDNPRRATGTSKVLEVDALAFLWEKHSTGTSEIFADPKGFTIDAILNADAGAGEVAGHRDHRVVLELVTTDAWKAWARYDGQLIDQQTFAEFIEERISDIAEPSGADMLELAQSFEATVKADFKQAALLGSGERKFVFEETVAAKAGQRGELTIPSEFVVALQPFEASDAYRITARFRYRLRDGHLLLGYKLDRPEDVQRSAFKDVVTAVGEACGYTPLVGTAPAPRSF